MEGELTPAMENRESMLPKIEREGLLKMKDDLVRVCGVGLIDSESKHVPITVQLLC